MCGIIGIASSKSVSMNIINSLKKLEYRGYDSAGLATISKNEIINAPVSRNILFSPADETNSAGKIEISKELKLPKEIKVSMLKSRFLIFL